MRYPIVDGVVDIPLPGFPVDPSADSRKGQENRGVLRDFVAGPENRLVELVVRAVLERSGHAHNPLVFYGPTGTGKSHLARGLAGAWKNQFRRRSVVHVTAVDFARELADAIETQTIDDFRTRYRPAGLLVVEDLGHIGKKEAAQRELRHTLDVVIDAGGYVVLTMSVPPSQLAGFADDLKGRLLAGLSVPLALPGVEARHTILGRLADLRGIRLAEPVVRMLAEKLPVSVPQLSGALLQLEMTAGLDGGSINVEAVRRYLGERTPAAKPSMRDIAVSTARHFSLTLADLRSSSRRRAVVTARGVAMYLTRTLTGKSLEQIGKYFGGRDHTTVSYGCQQTEQRMKTDVDVRQAVLQLQDRWQAA